MTNIAFVKFQINYLIKFLKTFNKGILFIKKLELLVTFK